MNLKTIIGGVVGNIISFTGLSMSSEDLANITSVIVSIVGLVITIVSVVIIPLVRWWKEAKKDGKIDSKEIKDATNIIQNGIETIASKNKKDEKGEK